MKHLFLCVCLFLSGQVMFSQSTCQPPTYLFNNMSVVSGSGGLGSIYRFTNTLTGLNTFATITKLQNASISNANMDITGAFAQAWQPTIRFTSSKNPGDSSYIEFSFKFVQAGSGLTLNSINNSVAPQTCLAMTVVDCDGPGNSNSYREMVKVSMPATPVGIKNSTINVTQDARWVTMVSGAAQFSNIDTTDYAAMAQINFPQNTTEFKMRIGAVGSVTANLDRQFSFYFKSFTGLNFVLPVSLINFTTYTNKDNDVVLNWSTASETDADRFEVYRSFDGKQFEMIGQVKAAGNSHSLRNYSFTDGSVSLKQTKDVFYQLKMVEMSGAYDWSFVSRLRLKDETSTGKISLYPNPARDVLNIELNKAGFDDLEIEILDIYGKVVKNYSIPEAFIEGSVRLDIAGLVNGVYLVRVNGSNGTSVSNGFIKE